MWLLGWLRLKLRAERLLLTVARRMLGLPELVELGEADASVVCLFAVGVERSDVFGQRT